MKKRILALILMVCGMISLSFPALAADSSSSAFHLNTSSVGVGVGKTFKLTAYFGSSTDLSAVWSSADSSVATVDGEGTVTGNKIGQTIVTAKSGSYSSSCVINVAYKGIDVSKYQGTINWAAVKSSGIDFAMLRTGFGGENWSSQTDSYFATNYSNARANGIKVGAYHYSYATSVAMAQNEAALCLHILNGRQLDYPVAYDVEDKSQFGLSSDTLGQIVQAFCSKIQAAGYKTVVYSYYNFYKAHLTSSLVSQYDTWIAHDTAMTDFKPYTMWQYGQRSVSGVSGNCDVDYSFYDYSGTENEQQAPVVFPKQPSEQVFTCDTAGTYTFGSNQTYCYKITTNDTITPTASSSNPAAVSVSYAQRLSDGYLFRLTSHGFGQSVITTTAGNGTSVSFTAVASGTSNQSTPSKSDNPSSNGSKTMSCDTTLPYQFGTNNTYIYKVYTTSSTRPTAVSSNSSAVTVAYYGKTSGGYLFRITNAGEGKSVITTTDASGAASSFTATGTFADQSQSEIQSDTPYRFSMKAGKTYMYKFTPASEKTVLYFSTGNGAILQSVSTLHSGGSYFYKIKAITAGQAGVYAKEQGKSAQRLSIVTVS